MVMRHNYRAGPVVDWVREDFPWVYYCPVNQAYGNNPDGKHFMGPVQGKSQKSLLPSIGVMLDKVVNVHRVAYPLARRPLSPAEFEHRRYRASL